MKMKRLVSAIAALTMSVSVFAGITVNAATTIYSNDFETSSDFAAGGKTDGKTYNPGTTEANTKGSSVIGIGSASGDANLQSPSFTSLETYVDVKAVRVAFDFKIDACTTGKSSNISLLGAKNSSAWLNSSQQILTISAPATGNGYFGTLTVNGEDVTSAVKETGTGQDIGGLNRDTTGWVSLDAIINFDTEKITYSLTKGANKVVDDTTVAFG